MALWKARGSQPALLSRSLPVGSTSEAWALLQIIGHRDHGAVERADGAARVVEESRPSR